MKIRPVGTEFFHADRQTKSHQNPLRKRSDQICGRTNDAVDTTSKLRLSLNSCMESTKAWFTNAHTKYSITCIQEPKVIR